MEAIDHAFDVFSNLKEEINDYKDTIFTEQETRIKIIDRILIEVLNWPYEEIRAEEHTGSGYLDYKLSHNGFSRIILEAKRDGSKLDISDLTGGRGYKISGPTLRSKILQEGIEQAINYCGHKNAELACVTNGNEWLVFRGNRLGDGRDTCDGMGIVFPSLDDITSNFLIFYNLLAYESVQQFKFRAVFQEAEGRPIRHAGFSQFIRNPESLEIIPQTQFASDVDRIMTSFFRRLSGDEDPDMILQCFVETTQSKSADERLARISQEFLSRIRDLNTAGGGELQEIIERTKSTHQNAFVVLIGTKGAGKSTFVSRFFTYVLDPNIRSYCLFIRINLANSNGDESFIASWLNHELLKTVEQTVFDEKQPEFSDFEGMFFDEYRRMSTGTLKHLYDTNKDEFKINFGRHVEKKREDDPHSYILRLLSHAVKVRKKLPVLVFDNADHFSIDFQERTFQYARALYEQGLCLIILPITDRTSWQIARQGALRTFEHESLYLPVPSPKRVLESRIEFLHKRIDDEEKEPGRRYFLGRGITLSLDNLKAFAFCLQEIFIETGEVSLWIEALSNGDIRTSLEIAKEVTVSPHIKLDDLFKSFIAKDSININPAAIKRALVKGRYNMYPGSNNRFIQNVFTYPGDEGHSPLLGLRILAVLRDIKEPTNEDPFITVTQLNDYFQACSVDFRIVALWLDHFLKTELCRSYDPTILEANLAQKVEITTSGLEHLYWGVIDRIYQKAMCEVTPIHDRDAYTKINVSYSNDKKNRMGYNLSLYEFLNYIINDDKLQIMIPELPAYDCQRKLNKKLNASLSQLKKMLGL